MTQDPSAPLLTPRRESSGDAAADNRFAWAQAAAADGDLTAAIELCEQTLEAAPLWAPAWFMLGDLHERNGAIERAAEAFRKAAAQDTSGRLGADLRLAALGQGPAPQRASDAYVSELFDQYASRFEEHLVGTLAYRGPQVMLEALDGVTARSFERAIDLGCGTGLAAKIFGPRAATWIGCDLSPAMVAAARRTDLYARVDVAEVSAFLQSEPAGSADLILAADVLVYLGDLGPVLDGVYRVLKSGGLFVATAQSSSDGHWSLNSDLRYSHSGKYIEAALRASQLVIEHIGPCSTRRERGIDVPGLVLVASKA